LFSLSFNIISLINSNNKKLIISTQLILWDKAPMTHKHAFEAVDRTLRDITGVNKPFGDKVIVFGDNFRQILPVIRIGSRSDIIQASLKQSYIWEFVTVLNLKINMRVLQLHITDVDKQKVFSEWLLSVGEGKNFINDEGEIELPQEIIHKNTNIDDFILSVFGNLSENAKNRDYVTERAILTKKNDDADLINDKTKKIFPGNEHV
jgi:hypothetical protein